MCVFLNFQSVEIHHFSMFCFSRVTQTLRTRSPCFDSKEMSSVCLFLKPGLSSSGSLQTKMAFDHLSLAPTICWCHRDPSIEAVSGDFVSNVRARRVLFVFLVQRAHWFQPRPRKKNKKNSRKCVPLDKFTWTSTVLDSRWERDRLYLLTQ